MFVDLSSSRDWVDGRPRSIKPSEVMAHCSLIGIKLDPNEYKLIADLDREYIQWQTT